MVEEGIGGGSEGAKGYLKNTQHVKTINDVLLDLIDICSEKTYVALPNLVRRLLQKIKPDVVQQ